MKNVDNKEEGMNVAEILRVEVEVCLKSHNDGLFIQKLQKMTPFPLCDGYERL